MSRGVVEAQNQICRVCLSKINLSLYAKQSFANIEGTLSACETVSPGACLVSLGNVGGATTSPVILYVQPLRTTACAEVLNAAGGPLLF